MTNEALILVDIQNDYFPGGTMELVNMEAAAENAARILTEARQNGLPIFHIQHIAASDAATFFLADTYGAKHHELVQPEADETVITKHFPNSFRNTQLAESLATLNISALRIVGAMSHMCIDATTRAAFDAGFKCTVVQDACATRDLEFKDKKIKAAEVHGAFMAALSAPYASVLDTNEVI